MTAQPQAFAFYGRVSTEDAQDPSLSIPRTSSAALSKSGSAALIRRRASM